MQDFRNLKVWEKAHQLVLEVYRRTAAYPREEIRPGQSDPPGGGVDFG